MTTNDKLARAEAMDLMRANMELRKALEPFAAFDDGRAPEGLVITNGSSMARRQLTIGDCRRARAALNTDRSA